MTHHLSPEEENAAYADKTFKGVESDPEAEGGLKAVEPSGGAVNPENQAALEEAAANEEANAPESANDPSRGNDDSGTPE